MPKYYKSNIRRFKVPPRYISWSEPFADYNPPYYVSPSVLKHPSWADPESTENIKFNQIDGNIKRKSYVGTYKIMDGRPLNPMGRRGIAGRGCLGKWGPNHAVDIIIYKWGKDRRIDFVCIERRDSGGLAFPGGMVDNGETFQQATIREAMEEIFNIQDESQREKAVNWLKRNVSTAQTVSIEKSIDIHWIRENRATDNAWIETTVRACLVQPDDPIDFPIMAGDDAVAAFWLEADIKVPLHASHNSILNVLCQRIGAQF